jgi:pyridoxamine 5'-phosphate oxidase
MKKPKIAFLRKEYTKDFLNIEDVYENPLDQFNLWFSEALKHNIIEPNAMTLSTVDKSGSPSSRTVLLKDVDDKGFVFFTNYNSRKATQLEINPFASIVFLWLEMQKQVLIEGLVEKVSENESDEYFDIRPRDSQIGAWASPQSSVIESREELEKRFREFEKEFTGKKISRPPHWGGFRLIPNRVEFWQGRENRLHDRILYTFEQGVWKINRLAP